MTGDTLRQALAYAGRGWPVFPCQPGQKIPATTHGYRDATTNPRQITEWFTRHPGRNLAVATGAPGPDVLDIDQHGPAGSGFPAFARLRQAGLVTGASHYVRTPAAACTCTSPAPPSATATCPAATWTSAPQAATSWPRPPRSTVTPTSSCGPPAGRALSTGPPSLAPCTSAASRNPSLTRIRDGTWACWPCGSPLSPKATATVACIGPPTAPWRPTPRPTSVPGRRCPPSRPRRPRDHPHPELRPPH